MVILNNICAREVKNNFIASNLPKKNKWAFTLSNDIFIDYLITNRVGLIFFENYLFTYFFIVSLYDVYSSSSLSAGSYATSFFLSSLQMETNIKAINEACIRRPLWIRILVFFIVLTRNRLLQMVWTFGSKVQSVTFELCTFGPSTVYRKSLDPFYI